MKYVLGVFGVLVLLILAIILIFRRAPQPGVNNQTGQKQVVLGEYETKPATVSLVTRGEVTAEEERRAIRITVSRDERVLEVLEGYEEKVLSRQTYPNNEDAYKIFLSALDTAGFSRQQKSEYKDERGVCPMGRRYVYRLQDGSEQILRTWNTSCSAKSGTFGGNGGVTRRLFQEQIPDYSQQTRGVRL